RRMAAVVPQDGEGATVTAHVLDEALAAGPRLGLRQVEPGGIEQRPVLDVQRELEQGRRAAGTKRLGRAVQIPDRLVVAETGVPGEAGLLEHARRLLVAAQPVQAHPDLRLTAE